MPGSSWWLLVVNLLKVPLQAFVWHNISWHSIGINLLMQPVIAQWAVVGVRIVRLLPERVFRRFIQVVTILSVLMMVI